MTSGTCRHGAGETRRRRRIVDDDDEPRSARWRATSAGWHTCSRDEPTPPKTRLSCAGRYAIIAARIIELETTERSEERGQRSREPATASGASWAGHRRRAFNPEGSGVRRSQARDAHATRRAGSRGAHVAGEHDRIPFREPCNGRDAAEAGGRLSRSTCPSRGRESRRARCSRRRSRSRRVSFATRVTRRGRAGRCGRAKRSSTNESDKDREAMRATSASSCFGVVRLCDLVGCNSIVDRMNSMRDGFA